MPHMLVWLTRPTSHGDLNLLSSKWEAGSSRTDYSHALTPSYRMKDLTSSEGCVSPSPSPPTLLLLLRVLECGASPSPSNEQPLSPTVHTCVGADNGSLRPYAWSVKLSFILTQGQHRQSLIKSMWAVGYSRDSGFIRTSLKDQLALRHTSTGGVYSYLATSPPPLTVY